MFFINQKFMQNLPDLKQLDYMLRTIQNDVKNPATIVVEYELLADHNLLDYLNIVTIDPLIGGVISYSRDNVINFALDWLNIICHNCKNGNHNYNKLICRNIKQLVNNGKEYDLQNCRGHIEMKSPI